MNFKKQVLRFVILFGMTYTGCFLPFICNGASNRSISSEQGIEGITALPQSTDKASLEIDGYTMTLKSSLQKNDFVSAKTLVQKILKKLESNKICDSTLCKSNYMIGTYYLIVNKYDEALHYILLCVIMKEKSNVIDAQYANAIYNLGVVYSRNGDFNQYEKYGLKSLELFKKIYGNNNPELLNPYISTMIIMQSLKNYDKAISFADTALDIASKKNDLVTPVTLTYLYNGLGYSYQELGDQTKSKIYLDKTKSIYERYNLPRNYLYINLLNSLILNYTALGLHNETKAFYEEGIKLAVSSNNAYSFNFIRSYCNFLALEKQASKGVSLYTETIERAKTLYYNNPNDYIELLNYFAGYLREYNIDLKKSLQLYEQCFKYVKKNPQNLTLKNLVYFGYSQTLEKTGDTEKALELVDEILFPIGKIPLEYNENPLVNTLKPDLMTVRFLRIRHKILYDIYNKTPDLKALKAASNTSELIIALLDKVRINISEEESRLILGDKYRDSYLNSIHDFYLLYSKTGEQQFLEKAFEYSEKSKVAGLLTSTRELKATQFHIPTITSDYEKELQRRIGFLNIKISEETAKEHPNGSLIDKLKEGLLETTRSRDSLILIFEKEYPGYYAIKYNTKMTGLADIPELVGRNGNYINYVLSDTMLYSFIVNRKNQQLIAVRIDSSFFKDIKQFRSLLSKPSPSDNASIKFEQFQETGHRLYSKLIEPIKTYLISDKICISPDNILSYLPFEAIPSTSVSIKSNNYRDLNYMMNEFDISYTYSATLLAENIKKGYKTSNKLIAFAPNYTEPINIQSVMMSRQATQGILNDLPYARKEAEFVTRLTRGKLYENSDASESAYKMESGKYDVIHLAMHTLLNDKDPMRSTLLFSHSNDSVNDGYLKTYEVYGVPLKAKMVVLSSCNTGAGLLLSGEGIISLARGFIYSGSESVVMSMWEIEDKSGTDIVEMFYKNLKEGYSKSAALKKARIRFLKNADQLRSHPYFWSTLVIYGNNTPLYYSKKFVISISAAVALLILSLGFYFRKRRYS